MYPKAGNTLQLSISLDGPSSVTTGEDYVIFTSNLTLDAYTAVGRPAHNEHLTSGFVVGSGIDICPQAMFFGTGSSSGKAYINQIILNGYLSPL